MTATIPRLIRAGHEVIGVDYMKPVSKTCEFIHDDLLSSNWQRKVGKVDAVIHAAAKIYGVGGFNEHCAEILGDDLAITRNVLSFAYNNHVRRFVYISSSMVYERMNQHNGKPVAEYMTEYGDYLVPATDYGLSKYVGERMVESYYTQYQMPYTIWRPFNIITPYELAGDEMGVSHVFADYIKSIVVDKNPVLNIYGDGQQIRCFTWIDDVARAIADYSFRDNSPIYKLNVGSDMPYTMKALATLIHRTALDLDVPGVKSGLEFISLPAYKNDVRVRIPDTTLIKQLFNWETTVDLAMAVERCVRYTMEETV